MTIAKPTVRKPTWSEIRAPWTTRLNSSRTLPSRPKMVLRLVGRAAEQVDARRAAAASTPCDEEDLVRVVSAR